DDGHYRIVLTVGDEDGGSATAERIVVVGNVAPTPTIDSIAAVRSEGTAIAVTGSATDPAGDNDPLSYRWAVYQDGDGSTAFDTGTGPAWSFTPNDNGSYRIVLTVSDGDGGTTSVVQTIDVANVAPTPDIVSIGTPRVEGAAIRLSGAATDPAGANDSLTYSWQVFKAGTSTAF